MSENPIESLSQQQSSSGDDIPMEIMVKSVASQLIAKRAKNTIAVSVYATSVLFSMHDVLEEVAKTPGLAAEDVVELNGLASIIRAMKEALEAAKLEDRGRK